jgi:hypothetical protein
MRLTPLTILLLLAGYVWYSKNVLQPRQLKAQILAAFNLTQAQRAKASQYLDRLTPAELERISNSLSNGFGLAAAELFNLIKK